MTQVKIKRVYEPGVPGDGFRILVDRLWPRGMKKEDLAMDTWMKEAAPSNELRKKFHHESAGWKEFRTAYLKELEASGAVDQLMAAVTKHKTITLLYGAKDEENNQAVILKELMEERLKKM